MRPILAIALGLAACTGGPNPDGTDNPTNPIDDPNPVELHSFDLTVNIDEGNGPTAQPCDAHDHGVFVGIAGQEIFDALEEDPVLTFGNAGKMTNETDSRPIHSHNGVDYVYPDLHVEDAIDDGLLSVDGDGIVVGDIDLVRHFDEQFDCFWQLCTYDASAPPYYQLEGDSNCTDVTDDPVQRISVINGSQVVDANGEDYGHFGSGELHVTSGHRFELLYGDMSGIELLNSGFTDTGWWVVSLQNDFATKLTCNVE